MSDPDVAALLEIVKGVPMLTRKCLARRYGVDLDTIDRWHRSGKLPEAVYLPGCRYPFWRPVEILGRENLNAKSKKRARPSSLGRS